METVSGSALMCRMKLLVKYCPDTPIFFFRLVGLVCHLDISDIDLIPCCWCMPCQPGILSNSTYTSTVLCVVLVF